MHENCRFAHCLPAQNSAQYVTGMRDREKASPPACGAMTCAENSNPKVHFVRAMRLMLCVDCRRIEKGKSDLNLFPSRQSHAEDVVVDKKICLDSLPKHLPEN